MEIRFRVRDNGIGMSPEFLPHLYDPFSQERSEENITENLMDARILLVEDNEINIYVAQLILEKAGCVVEIANGTYHHRTCSRNYSCGPAETRALPCSLPSYLAKFLMKRPARSSAFLFHSAASA